jgi:small-conductance mechanosensitive channel
MPRPHLCSRSARRLRPLFLALGLLAAPAAATAGVAELAPADLAGGLQSAAATAPRAESEPRIQHAEDVILVDEEAAPPKEAAGAAGKIEDDEAEAGPSPKEIRKALVGIKRTLDGRFLTSELLAEQLDHATAARSQAGECGQAADDRLERVRQALQALGEKQADEAPDLAATRGKIAAVKMREEQRRAECRLAIVFADSLIGRIDVSQKNLLKQRLMRRGPDIGGILAWNLEHPHVWTAAGVALVEDMLGLKLSNPAAFAPVPAAVLAGVSVAWWVRRRLQRRTAAQEAFSARLAAALREAFVRHGLAWTPAVAVAVLLGVSDAADGDLSYPSLFGAALAGFATVRLVVSALLGSRSPLRAALDAADRTLVRRLTRNIIGLAATLAATFVISYAPFRATLPFEADRLIRCASVVLVAAQAVPLLHLLGRTKRLRRSGGSVVRGGLALALAAVVMAELAGYRNLSSYLVEGLLATGATAGAAWLLSGFVSDGFASLEADGAPRGWTTRLRNAIGLREDERFPGLLWLRLLITTALWGAVFIVLLHAWDLSDNGALLVLQWLEDGFALGDVRVMPAKILSGIALFAVLLAVARWIRGWVETAWLAKSRMDRGARDALLTITGYLGFAVAAVLGCAAAGFSLASIAMIASALSVGIGFGLQNVVGNFVAGLILLFERPIKTGDWVVVNGTEGIVKRIRVRATEIRTGERSDVSVPNSELISGHVKNWTLRDRIGRAVIPIGVAYGSDTELVRDLLLGVAQAHPGIIQKSPNEPVKVLFRGFGDCALQFELSFTVRNVDERGDVVSDINFAIDKAFRSHRVEIPYPQHEVRIRTVEGDALDALAIAAAARNGGGGTGATVPAVNAAARAAGDLERAAETVARSRGVA